MINSTFNTFLQFHDVVEDQTVILQNCSLSNFLVKGLESSIGKNTGVVMLWVERDSTK